MVEVTFPCLAALSLGWALATVLLLVLVLRRVRLWAAEQEADLWKRQAALYHDRYYDLLCGRGLEAPAGPWVFDGDGGAAHRAN